MKSFIKLAVAVIAVLAVIFTGANIILHNENKGDAGRPYRVEAERIAARIENREPYSLNDYSYIKNVEIQENGFQGGDSDYLVKEIGGKLYRFDYSYQADNTSAITSFNICFGVTAAFVLLLLLFLFIRIIRPFEKISAYPTELAKGNLTAPLKDSKSKYFGKFLWGLDLLREKLESQRSAELALQKQNKTMVLSLSHDIKTPLGVIELYAKALEKGLYKDEQKKKEVAVGITEKCEDIRGYVDGIVKTSSEDFLNLEVNNGEFYLSALIDKIKAFYTDKLSLLKIDFAVDAFSDHKALKCCKTLSKTPSSTATAREYALRFQGRMIVSSSISATAAAHSAKTSCRTSSTAFGAAPIRVVTAAAAWDCTSAAP